MVHWGNPTSLLFDLKYFFTFFCASISLAVKWDNTNLMASTENQVKKLCG